MRCGKCGAENAGYSMYCGWCGAEIPKVPVPAAAAGSENPSTWETAPGEKTSLRVEPEMRYCTQCGRRISASSDWCPFCGKRPWVSAARVWGESVSHPSDYPHYAERVSTSSTGGPMVGGVLAIVAGVLAIAQGAIFALGSTMYIIGSGYVCCCGGLELVFGLASILGGSCALKSENFTLAIVGAILGMLAFGFAIGFLLGLIAVIFIAMSHDEFA